MSAPLRRPWRLLVKTSVHPLKYLFCPNTVVSKKMENVKVMIRLRNELNLSETEGKQKKKSGAKDWAPQLEHPSSWKMAAAEESHSCQEACPSRAAQGWDETADIWPVRCPILSPGPAGLAESFEGMHETLPNLLPHSKRSEVIRVYIKCGHSLLPSPFFIIIIIVIVGWRTIIKDDNVHLIVVPGVGSFWELGKDKDLDLACGQKLK